MAISEDAPVLRIGELSRRADVSGHVLRAWERRYGLLQPVRSEGGFRLYTEADERRVRRMRKHLARGLSAAEAAQATLQDDASIAQEHFASNLIRGRLAGLARGWGDGSGPRAILACPPGEQHDLALMIFGVTLNRHGWRIDYLGVDTPIEELTRTAAARPPDLVVVAVTQPGTLEPLAAELATLADTVPLALAGAGAAAQLAAAVGARRLNTDPVTAAETIGRPR